MFAVAPFLDVGPLHLQGKAARGSRATLICRHGLSSANGFILGASSQCILSTCALRRFPFSSFAPLSLACSKQFMLCSLPELSAITTLNVAWSTAGSFTVSCCPLGRTRLWAQSLTCALSTWMPRSPATSPPCTCFYETWPPSIIAHIVLILCWLVMAA